MTQTNTYRALCDSVGAYEVKRECNNNKDSCSYSYSDFITLRGGVCDGCNNFEERKIYPPATAEQVLRLIELILKTNPHNSLSINFSDSANWFVSKYQDSQVAFDTINESIYALTLVLFDKGFLSKEEVAKALRGGE